MNTAVRGRADPIQLVFLTLALVLAGIHLYLGLVAPAIPDDRAVQFLVIASALLVGPFVYVSSYWHPVLYLLGAGFAVYLGAIWFFGGMEYFLVGVATGVAATGFVLLALYLFVREAVAAETDGGV